MTAPAWQRGYALEDLRAVAAMWQQYDGDIPLGAFTRVKENTVAGWLAEGSLQLWRDEEGPALGVVSSVARQRRLLRDFRDHEIGIVEPGDLQVKRLACRPGYEGALLGRLLRLASTSRTAWYDLWQEHPLERAMADLLHLVWRGTKIRASSELVGVWCSRGQPLELRNPHDRYGLVRFPSLEFDPEPLLEEIAAAGLAWADHYASYNKRQSWSALCLQGFGGDPDFIIKPAEMSKKWKQDNAAALEWECQETPLAEALPRCWDLAQALPGAKQRVRLMRLAPGDGELTRHADITDPEAGAEPGQLMRLHHPLATNPDVLFRSWRPDGSREVANMGAGEVWSLDTRKPHTARNGGLSERIHLVVDTFATPELLALSVEAAPLEHVVEPELWAPSLPAVEPWVPVADSALAG